MNVPVSDPLWRRPALLASALAGLLVGLAAYGVQWTREQVQAYEPSLATAAAVETPSPEPTPSPAIVAADSIEPAKEALPPPSIAVDVTANPPPPTDRSNARAASKQPPARAPRTKSPSTPRPAETPEPPAPVTAAVVTDPKPEPQPQAEAPRPQTVAEAMAEAVASSEPQAKTQPTSTVVAEPESYTPFDRDSAVSALNAAAKSAARCRSDEGPFGAARVAVTFAPNGNTTTAVVEGPPFAGTPVGSCIARTFREARVSPFTGAPVTVRKSVTIF